MYPTIKNQHHRPHSLTCADVKAEPLSGCPSENYLFWGKKNKYLNQKTNDMQEPA